MEIIKACFLVVGLAAGGLSLGAQPVQVGYSNCVAVAGYSQELMNQIGRFRWFFAHASVGENMMSGITALHGINTNQYQYCRASDDSTPPTTTGNGVIYDYARGNPGWSAKVSSFATYVSNGWRYPKIHLAVNKFCYIDQDANLVGYLGSMTNLEAAFPETVFVYMTIPLMTSEDSDNRLRNVFNDGLRDFTRTNNRVLFDVADIEAHDTNGAACLFTNNGRVCQRLCDTYSSDGGHLNDAGAARVAAGFYALAAALLAVDRDGDGMSDGQELIAGTRPTERSSVFKTTASCSSGGGLALSWVSATNRLYSLERGLNLKAPGSFTTLLTNAAATPPLNSYTDTPSGPGPFFYRVRVQQ